MSKFFRKLLGKEGRKEKEERQAQAKLSSLPDAELTEDDVHVSVCARERERVGV
jgi:hypothetical protein